MPAVEGQPRLCGLARARGVEAPARADACVRPPAGPVQHLARHLCAGGPTTTPQVAGPGDADRIPAEPTAAGWRACTCRSAPRGLGTPRGSEHASADGRATDAAARTSCCAVEVDAAISSVRAHAQQGPQAACMLRPRASRRSVHAAPRAACRAGAPLTPGAMLCGVRRSLLRHHQHHRSWPRGSWIAKHDLGLARGVAACAQRACSTVSWSPAAGAAPSALAAAPAAPSGHRRLSLLVEPRSQSALRSAAQHGDRAPPSSLVVACSSGGSSAEGVHLDHHLALPPRAQGPGAGLEHAMAAALVRA